MEGRTWERFLELLFAKGGDEAPCGAPELKVTQVAVVL